MIHSYLMKKFLHSITLFLLFISLIFDPTGEFFNLKYISVLIAFIVFGFNFLINFKIRHFSNTQILYLFVFCIFIPFYGLNVTLINTTLASLTDTSYIGFGVTTAVLIPVLIISKDHFINIFIYSLRLLMITIFVVLISFIYDGDGFGISQFFIDHKSMLMGFREYAGIPTYYIYFTASPLLIMLVTYDSYALLNKFSFKNLLLFSLSVVSIFLTGTRFNMLVAILILPVSLILNKYSLSRIFINSLFLALFLIVITNNKFTSSFFTSSEDSNNAKIGYLESYMPIFGNPKFILMGQGFNAHDWSPEFKTLMAKSGNDGTKTELTYLEFVRVFGIFFGLLLNLIVFAMPIILYYSYGKFNFLVVGILVYLLSSAINPYIFSTNGVLIFLLFLISIKGIGFRIKNQI
jgi:hypothetical protein